MVRLGLIQSLAGADPADNFDTIRKFVTEGKRAGCVAICFPEAFLTGYFPDKAAELALQKDHPLFSQIADLAQSQQMDLLIGFMEKEGTGQRPDQSPIMRGTSSGWAGSRPSFPPVTQASAPARDLGMAASPLIYQASVCDAHNISLPPFG